MKQHVKIVMSDKDMNDLSMAFMSCDREVEMEIKGNIMIHFIREDADVDY